MSQHRPHIVTLATSSYAEAANHKTIHLPHAAPTLSKISIHIPLLPLHILLINQTINILLNLLDIQDTSLLGRLNNLYNQLLVPNPLRTLHDPHDRGLSFEVTVGEYTLVRFFVLFFGLLQLDLVDLDAVLFVREGGVEREGVCGVDVTAWGLFAEGTELGAGQGLKCTVEFGFG